MDEDTWVYFLNKIIIFRIPPPPGRRHGNFAGVHTLIIIKKKNCYTV
jgi:hypothetical protein